jgi:hypothetical protein
LRDRMNKKTNESSGSVTYWEILVSARKAHIDADPVHRVEVDCVVDVSDGNFTSMQCEYRWGLDW